MRAPAEAKRVLHEGKSARVENMHGEAKQCLLEKMNTKHFYAENVTFTKYSIL